MSESSYRLEAPRPRLPPVPIRTDNLAESPSPPRVLAPWILSGGQGSPPPLVYDIRSKTPSSPHRMRSPRGLSPPTSPTARSVSRTSRNASHMSPPPSSGSRAPTPSQVDRGELEEFAEHCRAWYYNQDSNSGRIMTQTLATIPPSQRAPFSRLQSAIRSAYHASVNARRTAEFQAHINATHPGGSLMPQSRADPHGSLARKERYERLDRFIRTWCTMGMPGTKPFFQGLWAVIRLQVIPEKLGGAGGRRIEWEIDDAVFREAAGKDFMLDAIDVFKGVLGFEESSRRTSSVHSLGPSAAFPSLSRVHSRSKSQPLPSQSSDPTRLPPPITSTTLPKRSRAPSDPFLDTPVTPNVSGSYSSAKTGLLSTNSTIDDPPFPATPTHSTMDVFSAAMGEISEEHPDAEDYLRIWVAPDLSDPELLSLLKLFPSFVMRHPLPRFPISQSTAKPVADIEAGDPALESEQQLKIGTGNMWLGYKTRSPGYHGSWWTRFVLWWKRVFS